MLPYCLLVVFWVYLPLRRSCPGSCAARTCGISLPGVDCVRATAHYPHGAHPHRTCDPTRIRIRPCCSVVGAERRHPHNHHLHNASSRCQFWPCQTCSSAIEVCQCSIHSGGELGDGGRPRRLAAMLRPRHASVDAAQDEASPHAVQFSQFLQTKVDRWHWPAAMLLSMGVITLLTQVVPGGIVPVPGDLLRGGIFGGSGSSSKDSIDLASLSEFERQLYGCRSLKSGPIPFVDTEASLRVLDGLSDEQQQTADAYTAALATCTDFACLQRAHQLPRAPGQFNFPHFMVIGFPKCATTSLYCHLIQHPQVQHPKEKESHWLSQQCGPQSLSCPPESQQHYLAEVLNLPEAASYNFTKAAFEGSTHYVLDADWMAGQLASTFPWLRVVISLRDPISQAIAMHLHNIMHGREMNCTKEGNETSIYHCIRRALKENSRSHYPSKIAGWMEHFSSRQLHFVQYERLTSPGGMGGELAQLKAFLGVDPALPSSQLPLTNYKHVHTGHGPNALGRYWVMKRWELEHLVEIARNNTMETIKLLGKHGHASPQEKVDWLRNWERVWKDNLGRCEEGRAAPCKVIVS